MTRRQIDASREVRLWIGTICGVVFTVASIPELREKVVQRYKWRRDKIKELIAKRKGES